MWYDLGMGLDGVELVMEVEDRFNVRLADHDVERVRTVADLAALVLARMPFLRGVCPTARSFYELRTLLTSRGIERSDIRPRTRLAELFPPGSREAWKSLCAEDRRLPRLRVSPRVDGVLLWIAGLSVFAWFMATAAAFGARGGGVALLISLGVIAVGGAAFALTRGVLARHFPTSMETVGDIARAIAPIERSGNRLLDELRVLEEVRKLTAEQLGLPLERVRPESDFVRDLEMD